MTSWASLRWVSAQSLGPAAGPVPRVSVQPGAVIRPWENAWAEFIPFLDYDLEIRKVICSTNAIAERPLPAGGQGPRSLPDRAGRVDSTGDQVPLPGHPVP